MFIHGVFYAIEEELIQQKCLLIRKVQNIKQRKKSKNII